MNDTEKIDQDKDTAAEEEFDFEANRFVFRDKDGEPVPDTERIYGTLELVIRGDVTDEEAYHIARHFTSLPVLQNSYPSIGSIVRKGREPGAVSVFVLYTVSACAPEEDPRDNCRKLRELALKAYEGVRASVPSREGVWKASDYTYTVWIYYGNVAEHITLMVGLTK